MMTFNPNCHTGRVSFSSLATKTVSRPTGLIRLVRLEADGAFKDTCSDMKANLAGSEAELHFSTFNLEQKHQRSKVVNNLAF